LKNICLHSICFYLSRSRAVWRIFSLSYQNFHRIPLLSLLAPSSSESSTFSSRLTTAAAAEDAGGGLIMSGSCIDFSTGFYSVYVVGYIVFVMADALKPLSLGCDNYSSFASSGLSESESSIITFFNLLGSSLTAYFFAFSVAAYFWAALKALAYFKISSLSSSSSSSSSTSCFIYYTVFEVTAS